HTYTIAGSKVTATSFPAVVDFSGGGIAKMDLLASGGATVNLDGLSQSGVTTYNFTGGTPPTNNTLNVPSGVATLDFATAGTLTFGAGQPTVNYTNFATVNVTKPAASPVGTGVTINTTAGQALINVVVATFTESDLGNVAGDFTATIDWGDSTTTPGTVQSNGANSYNILGSHTYFANGSHTVNIPLTDLGSAGTTPVAGTTINVTSTGPVPSSPSPILSSASVAVSRLTAQGATVKGVEGSLLNPASGGDVLVA